MKIFPQSFRLRVSDLWRQLRGCTNLGCLLPVVVILSVLYFLPWESNQPSEIWWSAAMTGLQVSLAVFLTLILVLAMLDRRSKDVNEAREASRAAQEIFDRALASAETARNCAVEGFLCVNQAESYFDPPSYIPFWLAADKAQKNLGQCCQSLDDVQRCRLAYAETLLARNHTFSDLDEKIDTLYDPRSDLARLTQIVHQAHRDRDFAGILAQLLVRQAIERGFDQLATAIQELQDNLVGALEDLKTSMVTELEKNRNVQTRILQGVQFLTTAKAYQDKMSKR